MDLNGIDGTTSRILTMPPTLFVTIKKPLLNKDIDILFVRREVVTVLALLSLLPLFLHYLLD